MAFIPLLVRPGVVTQYSDLLANASTYVMSNLIRYKDGLLEKMGGWTLFSGTQLPGYPRGMQAWQSLLGTPYLAVGTNQVLHAFTPGSDGDITPVSSEVDLTNPFSTTTGLTAVNVEDVAHGRQVGDNVYVVTTASVGGTLIEGFFPVDAVVDVDNYTINLATPAPLTEAAGGAVDIFTTTMGSDVVNVERIGHGLAVNQNFNVPISTAVSTVTMFGDYLVNTVVDADNFTVIGDAMAAAADTQAINGGDVKIHNLLGQGLASAGSATGYGYGGFGLGPYGIGAGAAPVPLRQWFLEPWGEDLLALPTNGTLYYWTSSDGLSNNPAMAVAGAPDASTAMFLAMPARQVVLLGTYNESLSAQDPLLVKWSDVDDYSSYRDVGSPLVPGVQAGWYRLTRGSRIVGGIQGPQQGLIWTDLGLWLMQYVGPDLVYSFIEIAKGCGLSGARAAGVLGDSTYWSNPAAFYKFTGSGVQFIPCPVFDQWFPLVDWSQAEKICCEVNEDFNEIMWYGPSLANGSENDIYVKFNPVENAWDYGTRPRTAAIGRSVWGTPIAASPDGYVYQHESGYNDNAAAMNSFALTGLFALSEGDDMIFVERFLPDMKLFYGATVLVTIYMKEYPHDMAPVDTYGPFTVTDAVDYCIVRGRNRYMQIKIQSTDLNSFWRTGKTAYVGAPDGRR